MSSPYLLHAPDTEHVQIGAVAVEGLHRRLVLPVLAAQPVEAALHIGGGDVADVDNPSRRCPETGAGWR